MSKAGSDSTRCAKQYGAQNNTARKSAIDERTTRHKGYTNSQRLRMRIEEVFGWGKSIAGMRKTLLRGKRKNQFRLYLIGAAYNLLRVSKLLSGPQSALSAGS